MLPACVQHSRRMRDEWYVSSSLCTSQPVALRCTAHLFVFCSLRMPTKHTIDVLCERRTNLSLYIVQHWLPRSCKLKSSLGLCVCQRNTRSTCRAHAAYCEPTCHGRAGGQQLHATPSFLHNAMKQRGQVPANPLSPTQHNSIQLKEAARKALRTPLCTT